MIITKWEEFEEARIKETPLAYIYPSETSFYGKELDKLIKLIRNNFSYKVVEWDNEYVLFNSIKTKRNQEILDKDIFEEVNLKKWFIVEMDQDDFIIKSLIRF